MAISGSSAVAEDQQLAGFLAIEAAAIVFATTTLESIWSFPVLSFGLQLCHYCLLSDKFGLKSKYSAKPLCVSGYSGI